MLDNFAFSSLISIVFPFSVLEHFNGYDEELVTDSFILLTVLYV